MKLNHLGIAVKDIKSAVHHFEDSLGWWKKSEIIYDPIQDVRVLFMGDDNNILYELIEPASKDSPIIKLLDKKISLYHFCYEVDDIETTIKELSKKNFILISGPVEAVAFRGKRIAFMFNSENLTIELVEKKLKPQLK